MLILQTAAGEERLTLAPGTKAWRGSFVPSSAIRQGDRIILRKAARHSGPESESSGQTPEPAEHVTEYSTVAERVWAQIGRVAGTIIENSGHELLVDEGPARGRQVVLMDSASLRQIQVRFPRIEPGYLIDVIGLRQPGYLQALAPATAQPPYRADHPPTPPLVSGHIPKQVSGTAVWHEPRPQAHDHLGVAYPALDPETNCEATEHADDPHTAGPGCVRLPYLSVGSAVRIHNECTELDAVLPVTSCGASARLFCDRCLQCGTSPRGRIAALTMTAFAELGGNLEDGCFNATLTVTG